MAARLSHPAAPPPRARDLRPDLAGRLCRHVLIYGNNLQAFLDTAWRTLHWAGSWWGWGSRRWTGSAAGSGIWVVARHVHPKPPLSGMILAGGMSAWAAYLTPLQSGAGADDDLHHAALRRPAAGGGDVDPHDVHRHGALLRASPGRSPSSSAPASRSGSDGDVLGLSLYDLFLGSLSVFVALGVRADRRHRLPAAHGAT